MRAATTFPNVRINASVGPCKRLPATKDGARPCKRCSFVEGAKSTANSAIRDGADRRRLQHSGGGRRSPWIGPKGTPKAFRSTAFLKRKEVSEVELEADFYQTGV